MSESDDGDNVPLHPTARKPAFTPSKDYLQYLDLGGELAQLGSLKDQRALKAAVLAMKNRTISELSIAIDETGQAIDSDRDEIDDMPTGNDQLVAARSLLNDPNMSHPIIDYGLFSNVPVESEIKRATTQTAMSQLFRRLLTAPRDPPQLM